MKHVWLLFLIACSDRATITAYGEDFIEKGFTTDDGWSVSFEDFGVTIESVTYAHASLTVKHVDLVEEGPHELGSLPVVVGTPAEPGFDISQIEVHGRATKDGITKTFAWVFSDRVTYRNCEAAQATAAAGATFQVTIHADHLFFDSIVSEAPALLFDNIAAADANGDGEISENELRLRDIGAYDPGNEDISDMWSFMRAQAKTLGHADGEGHCLTAR